MISVCIYCGCNKNKALEVCGDCAKAPESHNDVIHSIIMSYSENEPYLNFLSIDEIEVLRGEIVKGSTLQIDPKVFREAEEAFSAARAAEGPQALKFFSRIAQPVTMGILILFVGFLIFGA